MMKRVKDGWHKVYGIDVWVENNVVIRGIIDNKCVHPFRWNDKGGYWNNESGYNTLDSVRSGLNRGTMCFK